MAMRSIPRMMVKASLQGARLPLTGLEAVAGQRGNLAWPPALVFEGFEAGTKVVAGSLLRDPQLVDEGRVQQAKLSELRRASELEVKAEQARAAADAQLEARLDHAEQRHEQADEQAEQRARAVETRTREAEQQVQRELAQRAEAVAKADAAREKRMAKTERVTRLRSIEAESAALADERQALAAVDKVTALDKAVERKKSQRKSS
jgi:hypothetical protein